MVLLVYIEGICVLYSSYIIVLVVFGYFALSNSCFSLFSIILQVCGRDFASVQFTLLDFSLIWFNLRLANFSSVKLIY